MPLTTASISAAPGGSAASIVFPEGDDNIDDEEEADDDAPPERRRRNFICTWAGAERVNDGERLGRERRPALPRQATDKGADAGKGSPSFLVMCGGM